MRYASKRGKKAPQAIAPIESVIPLLDPVRIYTAKELAAMPLSKMNECIAAQEAYYIIEHTTKMGGGSDSTASPHAKWRSTDTGQREIKNALQAKQRFYRTSNCSAVGKARLNQVGRA